MIRRGLAFFPAAALLALAHPLAAGVGPVGQAFVPITACRTVDTRGPAGPNGGPALGANALRIFPVAGTCGVPANALGLVVNLTVVNPAAPGYAQLFAGDAPVPPTTVLSFKARNTRAGFAFVALAANGSGTVGLANGSAGSADYILDVVGYFVLACTSPITVTNPATAAGAVSAPFSQTFTSSGGFGATTFATASPLPAGLTLAANGTLAGTPTRSGTFPITVTATDQNGCTGTGPTYTLVIACQTISVTNPAVAAGTANSPFSQTFTQTGGVGTTTFSTVNALPIGMTLAANGILSGTPTQAGSFDIVVTATDANGCFGAGATYHLVIGCQTIAVTNPATAAGTVNAPFSQTFTQAGAIGSATFSTLSALPAGLTLAANGLLSGTPTQKGSFPIVVKVTDGNLCTGAGATYNLSIGCQVITVTNPGTSTATAGTAFSQTFTASSTVGAVTFSTASTLPTGLTLGANGVLSGTPTQTGSFPIVVTATDTNGCFGSSATYTLVVGCQTWSVGPATLPQAKTGVAYPATTFTHAGGIGTVSFAQTGTLPTGMGFASGVLSGTPTQTGSFPITVTATDANGCTASHDYLLVVVCSGTSITLSPSSLPTVAAGSAFPSTTFTASGGAGPYTFARAGALPAGMTFTVDTLAGTPTQTGTFPITISATDASGCAGSQDYVVTVTCVGVTIAVAPPTLASGSVGTAYGPVTFTASGGTSPYTLAKTGALPPGMTFTAGVLSGTPTAPGTFPIVVTATDAAGCAGSTSYTLVTACPTITVSNPVNAGGTAGAAFSETFAQSGGIGAVTFSTTSTLPTGLTLSSAGVLSGTTNQVGTFPIVVTATDANGCTGAGTTYNLVINCQPINVTNPVTATGAEGNAFDQVFSATGILGTATWSTASTLPTGLTLNSSTGHLSGTPTQTGSFPIVVKATDTNGCFGTSATYTLVLTCPTITVSGTIPALTYNTAMSTATFTQSGTTSTITWSATGLPAGLGINSGTGAVTGTPTATGTFSATITATDAGGCTGSKSVTVTVAPTAPSQSYTGVGNTPFYVTGVSGAPTTPAVTTLTALLNGAQPAGGVSVTAASCSLGGTITTFDGSGRFIFTPNVSATSATCSYTISSNTGATPTATTATASLTFTLSGKVWYVDNATASGTNDGRSATPFKTMTAVGGAGTGTGDFIYVAKGSGSTTGAYTMLASQQLIGAGATLSVPTVGPVLTVAGNAANTPVLSGTLTLASSVVVNGIDMSTGSSTAVSGSGGLTGVTFTARNVASTTATAVNLNNVNTSTFTFRSLSSNGAANGISLSTFAVTSGAFTVTGDGTNNASGGTIQNATIGVLLSNARNVSLTSMSIQSTTQSGIDGQNDVRNFSFVNGTINNSGTSGTPGGGNTYSNIGFNANPTTARNIQGTLTVTGSTLTNAWFSGIDVQCGDGTLASATITGNTITSPATAATSQGQGINFVGVGGAATTFSLTSATIASNTIRNFPSGAGIQVNLSSASPAGPGTTAGIPNDATNIVSITGNDIQGLSAAVPMNTSAIIFAVSGANPASRSRANANISNNGTIGTPLSNMVGTAILVGINGDTTATVATSNNVIVAHNSLGSQGIGGGNGISNSSADTPDFTWTIVNNAISATDGNGILAEGRGVTGSLKVKIQGNTVAAPLGGIRPGIRVDAGNATSVSDSVCLNIAANSSAGSGGAQGIGLRKQGTNPALNAFGVNGMAATATPAVEAYVDSLNPAGGGTLLISATSGFSNCSLP
ncbi:MAG TPA: Ig domain-containing protein [Thermoanaerobaculia bacterium]|jgi:hypothetical protein